ncbi:SEC-C metal-binding domain-containing protein [Neobacillus sp. OS1-33]
MSTLWVTVHKRCYCGSKKSFKKCHGNVPNFN